MEFKPGVVYFAGAGPGDPELITVKAAELIRQADLILYAGSLVNPEVLRAAKPGAVQVSTAKMALAEQVEWMRDAAAMGQIVARLHTGDPSLYSSITEQIAALNQLAIPWAVIPGVTAAFAAAASLGIEYTLPLTCQSLILTRTEGKTPVPDAETLRSFAAHHCSVAIYLSTGMIGKVVDQFRQAGYADDTPVAVVYRASWADEHRLLGTLADIEAQAESAGITHQSLILVSPALRSGASAPSHLYGTFQDTEAPKKPHAILTLSSDSVSLGRQILASLPEAELYIPQKHWQPEFADDPRIHRFEFGIRQALQEAFQTFQALICIMASGIVVRELAPCLRTKHDDPAVVVLDNQGRYAISLLSGHGGGANALAEQVAAITHGQAVITTASDTQQLPALDTLIKEAGWRISAGSDLTALMAALVDHQRVALVANHAGFDRLNDFPLEPYATLEEIPAEVHHVIFFTRDGVPSEALRRFDAVLILRPKTLWLGIGCNKGTSTLEIAELCEAVLAQAGLSPDAVCGIATIPEKADEPGLVAFGAQQGLPLRVVTHEAIREAGSMPTPSRYTEALFGIEGVAEPCALLAAGAERLLVQKQKSRNVTLAIAEEGAAS